MTKREQAIEAAIQTRQEFYEGLGEMDADVLAPIISPMLMGGYDWPANRPQYRVIRTEKSTIIITDGLSDPFEQERFDKDLHPSAPSQCTNL